jgi:hypothetical protein
MDLLDFAGEDLYFDDPLNPEVEALIARAAECYGSPSAEQALLHAYFLEPEHLIVLVALYRYFYYRHRYREAMLAAERAIAVAADRLDLPRRWQDLSPADLDRSAQVSMTMTRFLLLALKGSGYLAMRLGEPGEALARFDKIVEVDSSDRLGMTELRRLAQTAVAQAALAESGDNPTPIRP